MTSLEHFEQKVLHIFLDGLEVHEKNDVDPVFSSEYMFFEKDFKEVDNDELHEICLDAINNFHGALDDEMPHAKVVEVKSSSYSQNDDIVLITICYQGEWKEGV